MSGVKGKVGGWELQWRSAPAGDSGTAHVDVTGKGTLEVRWRRDAEGLWIELPHGVFGFDFEGEKDDAERVAFRVTERGTDREWNDVSFVRSGQEAAAGAAAGKKSGVRVRAQMPGKIVRVMVKQGGKVEKEQPLLVMEAMKMENEIRAPHAGKVTLVKVSDGQAVESGADLMMIEAE